MKKFYPLIPYILFIFHLLLHIIGIGVNSLAGDEPASVYYAQMDISDIIRHLKTGNNPPFYEIFLHFWIALFGIGEVAVRFPSLLFSALTSVVLFRIGNDFFSRKIGFVSALFFCFSNYATIFSHESRVYALFGMLTALSFFYFLKWLNKQSNRLDLIILTLVYTLLLYSHYFGIMVLFLHLILGIVLQKQRLQRKMLLLTLVSSFLLFLPYIAVVIVRFFSTYESGTWLQSPNGWDSIEYVLIKFMNSVLIVKLFIGLFLISILTHARSIPSIDKNVVVIFAGFLVPFLGMFFISYHIPMFHDRYLMHSFICFSVFVGIILHSISSNTMVHGILSVLFLGGLVIASSRNIDNGRHTKEAVEKVQTIRDSGTRVILYPKFNMVSYSYYFNQDRFKDYDYEYGFYKLVEGFKEENFYGINQYSEARIDRSSCDKLIFIMTEFGPKEELLKDFKKDFWLEDSFHYPEIIDIYIFKRK